MYSYIIMHNMILEDQKTVFDDWNDMYVNPKRNMQRNWIERCDAQRRKAKETGIKMCIFVFNGTLWSIFGKIAMMKMNKFSPKIRKLSLKRKVPPDNDNENYWVENLQEDMPSNDLPQGPHPTSIDTYPFRLQYRLHRFRTLPSDPADKPRNFDYDPNQRKVEKATILGKRTIVNQVFNKKSEIDMRNYLIRLNASIDCVKLCMKTENPMRGRDESVSSLNRGMYLEALHFLRDHNEEIRAVTLENAPKNCILTSPKKFQKEYLELFAK
ncbi:zinc finger MYM-type protein 1-like protein [Tanacetum coccineum]